MNLIYFNTLNFYYKINCTSDFVQSKKKKYVSILNGSIYSCFLGILGFVVSFLLAPSRRPPYPLIYQ